MRSVLRGGRERIAEENTPTMPIATLPLYLLLCSALMHMPPASRASAEGCTQPHPGGPPTIRIAGKAGGTISRAEWAAANAVTLMGCAPSAQVVSIQLCIRNCEQRLERLACNGANFMPTMKTAVANLPAGTTFIVEVVVVDAQQRTWEVAPARFTIL
jgi:hypothetical protein